MYVTGCLFHHANATASGFLRGKYSRKSKQAKPTPSHSFEIHEYSKSELPSLRLVHQKRWWRGSCFCGSLINRQNAVLCRKRSICPVAFILKQTVAQLRYAVLCLHCPTRNLREVYFTKYRHHICLEKCIGKKPPFQVLVVHCVVLGYFDCICLLFKSMDFRHL